MWNLSRGSLVKLAPHAQSLWLLLMAGGFLLGRAEVVNPAWIVLGGGVLGIYCIGSLAHGGFSRRYSDIDMAVIVQEPMAPPVVDALLTDAVHVSAELAGKLSIFWTDRSFVVGRFPALDRIDYLDHAVALMERERVTPLRPPLAEVRAYLAGPPFGNWCKDAARFGWLDRDQQDISIPRFNQQGRQVALEAARERNVPLPIASLLRDRMIEGLAQGLEDADWSVLGAVAARAAGLNPTTSSR